MEKNYLVKYQRKENAKKYFKISGCIYLPVLTDTYRIRTDRVAKPCDHLT